MQAADKIDEMRASLKFIADIATEELQYVKVGTGAEVALRHINRRARAHLYDNPGPSIKQRDAAEECLSQMFYIVTGRSPEWSNWFGHAEALEEVGDALALLRQAVNT